MASQIKGLSQFIADLRVSSTQEAEKARVQAELANLRKKLAASKASVRDGSAKPKTGYEFRKAVSKLLYIYILGYDVDLGTDEIGALLHMPRFAEKQVGYLALTLLLHARADLHGRIEPIVVSDLRSPKEVYTSLALNYVSTWALADVSDSLVDLVYQLLVSPTSSSAVTKKAALTFLSFYRQDPGRFAAGPDWPERVERITAMLSSPGLGVTTSIASLLIEIAKADATLLSPYTFRTVVHRLNDVFEAKGFEASDYMYHSISAPWLVARLCDLLLYLPNDTPVPEDRDGAQEARDCVRRIIVACISDSDDDGDDSSKSQQHINARNMVFFAALRLGARLGMAEWGHALTGNVLSEIKQFLIQRDTNLRYLALEALQLYASSATSDSTDLLDVVLSLVKDRDVSVRRQALDTLYKLVDQRSVERIAAELLDLLVATDLQIRPQMVARLAALVERFATSHEWYFDTCIALLTVGGTYAGDEVWQRLAQVVVNNEPLQAYAVNHLYKTLSNSRGQARHSDAIVKVAAFLFGEFPRRFDGDVMQLFVTLQDLIGNASWVTKAILLNAYIKFAATYPEMRPQIAETLSVYCTSPDLETQIRANEYSRMLLPANQALLPHVFDEMPPFGAESSAKLFARLGSRFEPTPKSAPPPLKSTTTGAAPFGPNGASSPTSTSGPEGLAMPLGTPQLTANATGSSARNSHLSSGWEFGFRRMLTHSEAVLFQDALLQVGCRYEFRQDKGCVILYLKNISSFSLTSVAVQVNNPMDDETLSVRVQTSAPPTLAPGAVAEQVILCEAGRPFALTPTCRVTYLAGTFAEVTFKLPIVLERFMSPSAISTDQFNQRWEQVGPALEFTKTFQNFSVSRASASVTDDKQVISGLQYGLVPATGSRVHGAGILHTARAGMFGCLVVLEPDSSRTTLRVTVRATQKKLVAVVLSNNLAHAYQL